MELKRATCEYPPIDGKEGGVADVTGQPKGAQECLREGGTYNGARITCSLAEGVLPTAHHPWLALGLMGALVWRSWRRRAA